MRSFSFFASSVLTGLSLALIIFLLVGCATGMTDEATRVRVTKDEPRQCTFLGTVTDDRMADLQAKAAKLGGNVAVVVTQTEASQGYKGRFHVTNTTASVYRCSGSS
jgi:hypothetical protein